MSDGGAVTLRRAVAADVAALAALNQFVHDGHLTERADYFKPTDAADVAAWFASFLERRAASVWIAEDAGQPVGYVAAMVSEHAENAFRRARRWCEIDQLAVDPRARRRGIATRLLDRVISEAEAHGVEHIELSTWAFNEAAQATFRRAGFTPRTVRLERRPR
jgi:ribosomal protein S18 acetylase RimI-like enzyme